ncbi:hypothetical protein B296_00019867 [Ensete ventricosum]|uniref:STAS domain-containing protein n=1 Tax=Ensete ventricosum TaxID=4639 RepID=A0A426ZIC7_ENSVE|nr:hypothetical protein B296_00019867 [Ensete ventricosum]
MANHSDSSSCVHKVGFPPRRSLATDFTRGLKETFFADDPLRPYKDQPRSKQLALGLRFLFPALEWGRDYNLSKLKGDIVAGLTIANSSFVPPLVYAAMGSSRDIAIGPVAVVSLLLGALLQNEFDPVTQKEEYRRLAFTATFFAGVTQAALGFLRLGFLIDFLSHAAIVGFMGGAAITIALQQLKGFLGIKKFTKNTDIVSVMRSGKKKQRQQLFWVPAIAPLISVILATFLVYITRADEHGVQIVSPSASVPYRSFSRSAVNYMAGCQTTVSNVVMSLVVMLTLLVLTPLFQYTPNAILSSIIISAVLGLIDYEAAYLIWKVDRFDFVACMGAFFGVVFMSVEIGLLVAVSISLAKILLQVTRPRTALLGNLPGTMIYRNVEQYPEAIRVPGVLIVRVDSAIYFSNSNYVKERILRWLRDEEEQQNANDLPRVDCLIIDMSRKTSPVRPPISVSSLPITHGSFLLLAAVTDVDTSGIHALKELHKSLQKREVQVVVKLHVGLYELGIANPGAVVVEKLRLAEFIELIGQEKLFLTVGEAVIGCAPKVSEDV